MRSPIDARGSLSFQFIGIIDVPGGSIPPFGTKTSRPAMYKIAGTESKTVANGLLGVIASDATLL